MSRPKKKPEYDPQKSMEELMKEVSKAYGSFDDRENISHDPSLNELAVLYGLNVLKVRKLLITAGVYSTVMSRKVAHLTAEGLPSERIAEETGLSRASVNSYMPYRGVAYKMPMVSVDADRSKLYRKRKQTVERLQEELSEASLWEAVVAFQGYLFYTVGKKVAFRYTLKIGRDGMPNRELILIPRKKSKTLTWSSIRLAFEKAKERQGEVIPRPKTLGDIRGISYVYAMFLRWGIVVNK